MPTREAGGFLGESAIMDIWKRRGAGEKAADIAKIYGVTDIFVRKLSASKKGLDGARSAMARRRAVFEVNKALDAMEAAE